jgi:hypothetical protein
MEHLNIDPAMSIRNNANIRTREILIMHTYLYLVEYVMDRAQTEPLDLMNEFVWRRSKPPSAIIELC